MSRQNPWDLHKPQKYSKTDWAFLPTRKVKEIWNRFKAIFIQTVFFRHVMVHCHLHFFCKRSPDLRCWRQVFDVLYIVSCLNVRSTLFGHPNLSAIPTHNKLGHSAYSNMFLFKPALAPFLGQILIPTSGHGGKNTHMSHTVSSLLMLPSYSCF